MLTHSLTNLLGVKSPGQSPFYASYFPFEFWGHQYNGLTLVKCRWICAMLTDPPSASRNQKRSSDVVELYFALHWLELQQDDHTLCGLHSQSQKKTSHPCIPTRLMKKASMLITPTLKQWTLKNHVNVSQVKNKPRICNSTASISCTGPESFLLPLLPGQHSSWIAYSPATHTPQVWEWLQCEQTPSNKHLS